MGHLGEWRIEGGVRGVGGDWPGTTIRFKGGLSNV